ncbi:MAG: glycosyltransferase, partial [Acidimicrobiales bacterium]
MTPRSGLARWVGRRHVRGQRLSVIVPVYNVESMLAASLDSILAQPIRNLEVVVVDDGSTDGSAGIARDYAARYPEITLIVQQNGGVSHARNVGCEHCTGDLLTFVDPDDVLPSDAWTAMVATLESTGSDFAIGMMERVDAAGRRSRPPLLGRNHAEQRLATTIDEAPLLVADVFPCNKVFRLDFWRRHGLMFPVGLRYEDQVLCTEAFLSARTFDVLTDVVYEWHVRADRSSATQARGRFDNLVDRMVTKRMT